MLATARHFVGNGTFDWQRQGFVFELPEDADTLAIAFGNAGTGTMRVTDVEFRRFEDGEALPAAVEAKPNDTAPAFADAPPGAIADFRMLEGQGHYVLNHAGGEHLALANLDWVLDSGRPALRFAENTTGRQDYRPDSYIGLHIFGHAQDFHYLASYRAYEGRQSLPFAMGFGGGLILGAERYYLHDAYYRGLMGRTLVFHRTLRPDEIASLAKDEPLAAGAADEAEGVTLASWIKPAAQMGKSAHAVAGDIIGYRNRRFILSLHGNNESPPTKAPYQLVARILVNDRISSAAILEADRWYHAAMTAEPVDGQQRVRLFVDGRQVAEAMTENYSE